MSPGTNPPTKPPTSPRPTSQATPTPAEQARRAAAAAQLFEELRPDGFALAYRMLGRVRPAEDVVQEAFLRLHHRIEDGESIEAPPIYLSTVVTYLCIDRLRSMPLPHERPEARPEPLLVASDDESLSLGFLVLVGGLSPEPRAAFLLHEVFDHPYGQIAAIVGTSEENARRLVTRARRHVEPRWIRLEPSRERREDLARRFLAAAQDGDVDTLDRLLAPDATLHDEGSGPSWTRPHPRKGRDRVARALPAWVRATTRYGGFRLRQVAVNGQPGAVVLDPSDRLTGLLALEVAAGGGIQTVTSIVDPERLAHVDPQLDRTSC